MALFDGYVQRQEHAAQQRANEDAWRQQNDERRAMVVHAKQIIEAATGLRREMLELHAPVESENGGWTYCEGCDQGCNCTRAWWPCTSWAVAVEAEA